MSTTDYFQSELLPEHRIFVTGEYVSHEALGQFARLFRATWHRLPREVRDPILAHWAVWRDSHAAVAPTVRFAPIRLIGKYWRGRGVGNCGLGGYEICFKARSVANALDVFAAELIAHELAHVYQHAAGYRAGLESMDAEADVDRLLTLWRFSFGPRGQVSRADAAMAIEAAAVAALAEERQR